MREGMYEIAIESAAGVDFPERIIGERTYVEGKPGEEYMVESWVNADGDGNFPVKSCMTYVYIDGKALDLCLLNPPDVIMGGLGSARSVGYTCDTPGHIRPLEFTKASTTTDYKDSPESATGQVMVLFYEVEKCAEPFGNVAYFPVLSATTPLVENNYPEKQPSLMTRPGREKLRGGRERASVDSMHSWRLKRDEPDAVLTIKCHTANTLDFLEWYHTHDWARSPSRHPSTVNGTSDDKTTDTDAFGPSNPRPAAPISTVKQAPPSIKPTALFVQSLSDTAIHPSSPLSEELDDTYQVYQVHKPPATISRFGLDSFPKSTPGVSSAREVGKRGPGNTPLHDEVVDLQITGAKRKTIDTDELDLA